MMLLTLVLSLLLVFGADYLFYDQPIGWTVGLYAVMVLLAMSIKCGRFWRTRSGMVIGLGVLGLVGAAILGPNWRVAVLGLLGLMSLGIIARQGWPTHIQIWFKRWLEMVLIGWMSGFMDARTVRQVHQRYPKRSATWWRGLGGIGVWVLPIVLGMVFVFMFYLANPLIEKWGVALSNHAARWIKEFQEVVSIWRLVFWYVVMASVWMLLRYRVRQVDTEQTRDPVVEDIYRLRSFIDRWLQPGTVVRCLIVFNVIFLAQTGMDMMYLVGGAELPDHMTYATYAHRGSYPLVATALLAGLFVLATFRPGGVAEQSPWARRLVTLWIVQNVFLAATAAWRLHLYVEVYTLSRMRIAAAIWLLLVALGLVWLIVRILRRASNQWLIGMNMLTLVSVLYVSAFVDFDAMIAWHNVQHCREVGGKGVPIDLEYLQELSPTTLPAIVWLRDQLDDDNRTTAYLANQRAAVLQQRLDEQLDDWRGWTWYSSQAQQATVPRQP